MHHGQRFFRLGVCQKGKKNRARRQGRRAGCAFVCRTAAQRPGNDPQQSPPFLISPAGPGRQAAAPFLLLQKFLAQTPFGPIRTPPKGVLLRRGKYCFKYKIFARKAQEQPRPPPHFQPKPLRPGVFARFFGTIHNSSRCLAVILPGLPICRAKSAFLPCQTYSPSCAARPSSPSAKSIRPALSPGVI